MASLDGVSAAIVAMATPLNLELYERLGFDLAEVAEAAPNDLLVAVRAEDEAALDAALAVVDASSPRRRPRRGGFGAPPPPQTVARRCAAAARWNHLGAGQHAFVEAMDAVRAAFR